MDWSLRDAWKNDNDDIIQEQNVLLCHYIIYIKY